MSGVTKTAKRIVKPIKRLAEDTANIVTGGTYNQAKKGLKSVKSMLHPELNLPDMSGPQTMPIMSPSDPNQTDMLYRRRSAKAAQSGRNSTILTGLGG